MASTDESNPTPAVSLSKPTKLFVGQIPKDMEEGGLLPHFQPFGEINEVKIIRDKNPQAHKGTSSLLNGFRRN